MEDLAKHVGGTEDWIPYMNTQWLISNYIFYRSKTWDEMKRNYGHIANCRDIWQTIFDRKVPKIIKRNAKFPGG